MLGIIPAILVFPLLSIIVVFLSVMIYFQEINRADELLATNAGRLVGTAPFVSTIEQELKTAGCPFNCGEL